MIRMLSVKLHIFWLPIYTIALIFSIFQIYLININGSFISMFYISGLMLIPLAIMASIRIQWKPIFFLIILLSVRFISLSWSADIGSWMKQSLQELLFIIFILATYIVSLNHQKFILNSFKSYLYFLYLPGFLIVVFQVSPDLENIFLKSELAKIVINPNLIDGLYNDMPNNILDPKKSGAFFVNANVAGAYFGIASFISLGFWLAYRKWLYIVSLVIFICFSLATGSKASIIFISLLLFLFLVMVKSKYKSIVIIAILFSVLVIAFLSLDRLDDFGTLLINALQSRILIWGHLKEVLVSNIFTGLGFGGWQLSFESYAAEVGLTANYPPHNTFIYIWAQSGLLALTLILAYYYSIIKFSIVLIKSSSRELNGLGISVLFSNLWVLLHGMGTNFGPIGDDHIFVLLAFVIGYSYARFRCLCINQNKMF